MVGGVANSGEGGMLDEEKQLNDRRQTDCIENGWWAY
jgi:hypothetical protein